MDNVPGQDAGADSRRAVYGRASAGITRVEITTTDGMRLTASREGKFYLAWWPSNAEVGSATGYDRDGRGRRGGQPSV